MAVFGPLYERVMRWSRHPRAEWYLGAMSFAESSFFPVPPDVMLIPMCVAERRQAWRFALVTTITSLLGGIAVWLGVVGALLANGVWPAGLAPVLATGTILMLFSAADDVRPIGSEIEKDCGSEAEVEAEP